MKVALLGTLVSSVMNFRLELIKQLVAEKNEVFVFCVDYDESSRMKIREMGGIPVSYSLSRSGINPIRDFLDTWKLVSQLKEISPDIVFSYFVKPVIFGTIAAWLAGVKRRIGMLEGLGYVFTDLPTGLSRKQKLLRKIQIYLYRVALPLLDKLIFLNHDDPVDLLKKNLIKVKSVNVLGGIGVDLKKYAFNERNIESHITFIFVGRLLAEKGIKEYIAAAEAVKIRCPAVRFVVLGGLDEENPGGLSRVELERLTAAGIVEYPGHVTSVKEWLVDSSVFVLPSYYREGVPCSTQEAMAVGRAVITTDMPGCRETVIDGVNGYLVQRWDSTDLAEKMLRFVENPELINKMGFESRCIAEKRFDALEVNARLIEMIKY